MLLCFEQLVQGLGVLVRWTHLHSSLTILSRAGAGGLFKLGLGERSGLTSQEVALKFRRRNIVEEGVEVNEDNLPRRLFFVRECGSLDALGEPPPFRISGGTLSSVSFPATGVFALFHPSLLPSAGFDGTAFVGVLPVCAALAGAAVAAAAIGAGVAGAKTAGVDDLRAESCASSALTSLVCV